MLSLNLTRKDRHRLDLAGNENDGKLSGVRDESILDVSLPSLHIVTFCQPHLKGLQHQTHDHPEFLHSEILANTVGRAKGERSECRFIEDHINRAFVRRRERRGALFFRKPAIGPENLRKWGEISWVAEHTVEMREHRCPFWNHTFALSTFK